METVLTTENRIAGRERGTVGWGEERKGKDDGSEKLKRNLFRFFSAAMRRLYKHY